MKKWKKQERGGGKIKKEKIFLCLNAKLNCHQDLQQGGELVPDTCTILVGDGIYNGMFFPVEELEKAYMGWDKVPININHSDDKIEDIVGYVDNPVFRDGKIIVTPVLDDSTDKYSAALGFIKSRMNAGRVPNVSVGVWLDRVEEKMDDGDTRLTARNLEADHLALVVHGACDPNSGCGIGLSNDDTIAIELSKGVKIDSDGNLSVEIPSDEYVDLDEIYELNKKILKEKIKMEERINE